MGLTIRLLLLTTVAGLALAAAGCSAEGERDAPEPRVRPAQAAPLPAPDAALPRAPGALAAALRSTSARLDVAIDRWRRIGGAPPQDVTLLALHHQRIVRLLAGRRTLSRAVLTRLPRSLRAEARDLVLARRELERIKSVRRGPPPRVRVGPAQPATTLRGHYRAAWRRFGVGWPLLAAVNHVETAFGRLRNRSVSGAQGPMQFMPATWRAYGMGGDIRDPRDAVMGAANYLHASGAPGNERRALFAYNPSGLYVSAVSRYARRIRADVRAFYVLYAWQVYWEGRRLTGP